MRRQFAFDVEEKVYARIIELARARGYTPTAYAKMLFEAAYAARVGKSGDMDLDALVGCVMVLWGAKKDSADIARALNLKESTVDRIITAWRNVMGERRAA